MTVETFTDMGTPFRRFKPRTARQCNGCRKRVEAGVSAWKPSANAGSWKPDAVVCEACGKKLRAAGE